MFIYLLLLISLNSVAYASGDSSTVLRKRPSGSQEGNLPKKKALDVDLDVQKCLWLLPNELWFEILKHVDDLKDFALVSRLAHARVLLTRQIMGFSLIANSSIEGENRTPESIITTMLANAERFGDFSLFFTTKLSVLDGSLRSSNSKKWDIDNLQQKMQKRTDMLVTHNILNFQNVTLLEFLGCKLNQFSISSIFSMKNLRQLNLSCCGLVAAPPLFDRIQFADSLEELCLSDNFNLRYDWLRLICEFEKLKVLDLSNCGIRTLPEELKSLKGLKELNISNNPLWRFDRYPDADSVRFNTPNSSSPLLILISQLPALKALNIAYCNIYNLEPLNDSLSLETLILEGNPCGVFPLILFEKLKYLDVSFTGLKKVPQEFKSLQTLHTIGLEGNELTAESIVSTFSGLPIKELTLNRGVLSQNEITQHFPRVLVKEIEPE